MADVVLTVTVEGLEPDDAATIGVAAVNGGKVNGQDEDEATEVVGAAATSVSHNFTVTDAKVYVVTITPSEGDWVLTKDSKKQKASGATTVTFVANEVSRLTLRTKFNKQPDVEIAMTKAVLELCQADLEKLAANNPNGKAIHELQVKFRKRFKGLA